MKNKTYILAIMLMAAVTLTACGNESKQIETSNNAAVSSTTSSQAVPTSTDKTKTEINKTYKAGTLEYKILHTRSLSKGIRTTAQDGNFYIIIGIEIKNTGSESFATIYSVPIAISQFALKDTSGTSFDVIAGTGDTDGRFEADKSISAGQTNYGELMYEVPKSATEYNLTICDEKGNDGESITLDVKLPE